MEKGLSGEDFYNLKDENGNELEAFEEGDYTVSVSLSSSDGKLLASAEKNICIGRSNGTVAHEITDSDIISRGGKDILMDWASENGYTVLDDLLPGMFGPYYQKTTIAMSYGCEAAEYLGGSIHTLLYNVSEKSVAYRLEMANYIQKQGTADDPDISHYYYFSLGEPQINKERSVIQELNENIEVIRIDQVPDSVTDGKYATTEEAVISTDSDDTDGWNVCPENNFAIMGVVKPYQLETDEVADSDEYGFCDYSNNVSSVSYVITDDETGSAVYEGFKATGLSRCYPDMPGEPSPSVYEYYHVFDGSLFEAGRHYTVQMKAYDNNNAEIPGYNKAFQFTAFT